MLTRGFIIILFLTYLGWGVQAFPFKDVVQPLDTDIQTLLSRFTLDDETVIARVNGETIFFSDIKFRFLNRLVNFKHLSETEILTLDKVKSMWETELDQLLRKFMITQFLTKEKLLPPLEKVEEMQQQYRETMQFYNDTQYAEYLKFHGLTIKEALLEHQLQLGIQAWLSSIEQAVGKPLDEECQDYYEQHKDLFSSEERVSYSEITLSFHGKADVQEEHRVLLNDIRKNIEDQKKPFSFYAKNFSDSEISRKNGGQVPDESIEKIRQELPFLLDMKEGDLSPIIQIGNDRFGLYKLDKRSPGLIKPYEEVKQSIFENLIKLRIIAVKDSVIKRLKDEASISLPVE